MSLARRHRWLAIGCLCLAACSRTSPAPAPFAIARISPSLGGDSPALLLNDSITVYFTADVLPVSVTTNSVTLVDEQGQSVPGSLRVGSNWVTFHPVPPVTPELTDGSYRPGATYRLMVAGSPRPDAVRAVDGRRLAAAAAFAVPIAGANDRPFGLPAPLRPPANDLPFCLRTPDVLLQQLPADAPRLQLHFTQPLLPASVTAAAFEITLLDRLPGEKLVPRSVRIVPPRSGSPRFDDLPGCTVEIDLGALPVRASGQEATQLKPSTWLSVQLSGGAASLRDYAGNSPLPRDALPWSIVAGGRLALAEWPAPRDTITADDGVSPTFEARGGVLRPRVRVEAGNGSLGSFRPRRDTTLRPGEPFDRGDGELVVSQGSEFAFLSIDIPENVIVRVEAGASPVQLLACGSVRIAGTLSLVTQPERLPTRTPATVPVRDLASQVPVAVIAAGDIEVHGRVVATVPAADDKTNLLLACPGTIDLLQGELPFQTMLAFEAGSQDARGAIRGTRGQTMLFPASFTYGTAPGADFQVNGTLPWRQLPTDRDGGVVHLVELGPDLQVAWQSAPADPVRRTDPDLTVGRRSRLLPVADQDTIVLAAGGFVRFALATRVVGGREPAHVREVRLCDR